MTAHDPYRPQMQPPPPPGWQQPYGAHPTYLQYPAGPYQHAGMWPQMAVPAPAMVDGFMLVQPRLKPIPSGQAIGSLVAGIGGTVGALPGLFAAAFSPMAGLTFFMLAGLLGGGSMILASYSRRQIKASGGGVSGRGVALSGLIMGIIASSMAALTALIAIIAI